MRKMFPAGKHWASLGFMDDPAPIKPKMGRPSIYSPELIKELCARIASGRESLGVICQADDMPGEKTVYTWLLDKPEFQQIYAQAREAQSEVYAQDMLDIALSVGADKEHINRARLQIDTMKWIASKLKPKKYGDSTIIRGDKENPLDLGLAQLLDAARTKRQELPAIEGTAETVIESAQIENKPSTEA